MIRPYDPADFQALYAINRANVPAVGTVSVEQFAWLLAESWACLVAESDDTAAGFVLVMVEGSTYQSANYLWFADRHDRFAYVDRIAVDARHQGKAIGAALYDAALDRLRAMDRPPAMLCCEVNTRPPNPGSLRFHKRMGFVEVGQLASADGQKAVAMMERRV